MDAIVTTDRKAHTASNELAREIATRLDLPLVNREKFSIDDLCSKYQVGKVLVAKKGALYLCSSEGELFFHPNMSQLRVKNLRLGQPDHMVEAMALKSGMEVLDCTLGFGADAIVASFVVGDTGKVVGLESSPLIATVTGYGLQHFVAGNYELHAAMRRIEVHNQEACSFLAQQPDNSFDVVYLDPMFRHPLKSSTNLAPLRGVADSRAVTAELLEQAKRVARQRVVMKETSRSQEFQRLGFPELAGGKWSKVHYGIIRL